jgi:hypothetical protein
MQAVGAIAADGWHPTTLRMDQLNDQDVGSVLEEEEVETGQHPEWKDIADRSPTYKGYWAQWKSRAIRDGLLERHWEVTDR